MGYASYVVCADAQAAEIPSASASATSALGPAMACVPRRLRSRNTKHALVAVSGEEFPRFRTSSSRNPRKIRLGNTLT